MLLFAGTLVPPAHSQTSGGDQRDQRCRYDYNRHADCTRAERRRLHAPFGLPPIETMHRQQRPADDVIVAIASLKQNGGLALIFRRDRDGGPMAEVRRAPVSGTPPAPMQVPLSDATWQAVVARSRALDVSLYADDRICTGGGAFTVQTIDQQGQFRSRMGDVCPEHPGNALFSDWSDAVIAGLPHCAALAPGGYDGAWSGEKLKSCFLLAGDRKAAGEVFNLMEAHDFWPSWRNDADDVGALFAADIAIDWPGLPRFGDPDDAAAFLTGGWLAPFAFETTAYVGKSADHVQVEGRVVIKSDSDKGSLTRTFGRFRSQWMRNGQGGFRMAELTVEKN